MQLLWMNFVELPLDFFFQNSASCPWVSALGGVGGQRAEELLIPAGMSSAIDVIVVNLQVIDVEQMQKLFSPVLAMWLYVSTTLSV